MEDKTDSKICSLTDDCLLNIFKSCDLQSLGRLSSTCKRFNHIMNSYQSVWLPKSEAALGSNMNSPMMVQRSKPYLSPRERCAVSRKWILSIYERIAVLKYVRCLPWLCMEQDSLFVSKGKVLVKLLRGNDGNALHNKIVTLTPHDDDVSKFVINGDEVISVGWDGKLCRFRKSDLRCTYCEVLHPSGILSVDSKNDLIVTGSKDKTIKLWKAGSYSVYKVGEYNVDTRVLSLCFLPSNRLFIAGLPGTKDIHPLPMFDIEKDAPIGHLGENFQPGGGVIDIYPECEHTVLTCGYDTALKMWDIRTPNNYARKWEEPYDNILYSVKSDHSYTLVCGVNRSGMFHVWDKRWNTTIYSHYTMEYKSPVYCLNFDASHVFTALNRAVLQYCFLYIGTNGKVIPQFSWTQFGKNVFDERLNLPPDRPILHSGRPMPYIFDR